MYLTEADGSNSSRQSGSERLLTIRHLDARFKSRLGELDALEDVGLSVDRGEFVCLVGPSGCGKSTLLRIVAGLLPPTAGMVAFEGSPEPGERPVAAATAQRPTSRVRTYREIPATKVQGSVHVGMVFQQPNLLPWRTVRGNVMLPLEIQSAPRGEADRRVSELLALVGLADFADEYPANLSGGMAQRAGIARALAQDPDILLLDEPFGALDAITRENMAIELSRIWEGTRVAVLMVTHNVEEAALLSDRVIVLSQRPGRVVDRVPVALPRPRSPSLLSTMALQQVVQRLRDSLCISNGTAPMCRVPGYTGAGETSQSWPVGRSVLP
jgi:NitT/TauT family transport system ATP-binding protein